MWAQPCAHVIFDTDPTPRGRGGPAQEDEMSQAMIRSVNSILLPLPPPPRHGWDCFLIVQAPKLQATFGVGEEGGWSRALEYCSHLSL